MGMDIESSELDNIWEEAKAFVDQGDYDKAIEIYKYIKVRYGHDPVANESASTITNGLFQKFSSLSFAEHLGYRVP